MTKVKICGITNIEDARLACEYGADVLGFNFYSKSPRYVSPRTVKEITREIDGDAMKVGVFVNATVEEILAIVEETGLDAIQLHGDEPPSAVIELKTRARSAIIKAIRVADERSAQSAKYYPADAILLDAYSPEGFGGTGATFDWSIAKNVATSARVFLAGGLSGDNVAEAIRAVRPYAVDACSQIESSPGKKDPDKLRAFIMEAKK